MKLANSIGSFPIVLRVDCAAEFRLFDGFLEQILNVYSSVRSSVRIDLCSDEAGQQYGLIDFSWIRDFSGVFCIGVEYPAEFFDYFLEQIVNICSSLKSSDLIDLFRTLTHIAQARQFSHCSVVADQQDWFISVSFINFYICWYVYVFCGGNVCLCSMHCWCQFSQVCSMHYCWCHFIQVQQIFTWWIHSAANEKIICLFYVLLSAINLL